MDRIRRGTLFGLLIVIIGGVIFHAPISVWLGTTFPEAALAIKGWKEALLLLAAALVAWEVTEQRAWRKLASDRLVQVAALFILIHLVMMVIWPDSLVVTVAGLLIDLRFVGILLVTYLALQFFPAWRRPILRVSLVAAVISLIFALLQVIVLPADFLKVIGYGPDTIAPYLTVDENEAYVRISGTLRGPNPLGLYATMVFVISTTFLWVRRHSWQTKYYWLVLLAAISLPALWFSYSRSSLLACFVAAVLLVFILAGRRYGKALTAVCLAGALIVSGALWLARDSSFVRHVVVHEDPNEGNDVNSNEGHLTSLIHGSERMLEQPFGDGVGSTGSASLLSDEGNIIENYYLYVAHEVGWLGLAVFVWLNGILIVRLYRRRQDWLALAMLTTGAGIMVAGLVLPVWADDTVALVWWGLAGVALAKPLSLVAKGGKNARTVE